MLKEFWRNIDGYKGLYQVSSLGRVRSFKWNEAKILTPGVDRNGYSFVNLCSDGKYKSKSIHRLVISAFIGKSEKQVNHKNGIKSDNAVDNLEYFTQRENMDHAVKNKLFAIGERNGACKLTEEDVLKIRWLYENTKVSSRSLANKYNISKTEITNIIKKKRWSCLSIPPQTLDNKKVIV